MKNYKLSVLIEKDEDNMYVAKVPDLPGCHSQAKTMQELLKRIQEAIQLCLEVKKHDKSSVNISEFVGVQQVEVRV
jgi:predicted RNase H-like HicB family nuclease